MIDISGDGRNNRGRPAPQARDDAVRAGVTINGLPILAIELDLEEFYRDNVIGGPGAFVIPAAVLRDLRRRHPEEAGNRDFRRREREKLGEPRGAPRNTLIVVIPGLLPGIHLSSCSDARRSLDPGDKHRDDSGACGFPV